MSWVFARSVHAGEPTTFEICRGDCGHFIPSCARLNDFHQRLSCAYMQPVGGIQDTAENLGEHLMGDTIQNADFDVSFAPAPGLAVRRCGSRLASRNLCELRRALSVI